jgi:deoxyuridine 5'-triphosphate nucleotidohydrolase
VKVYLAGPMRHIPHSNFPAFEEAAARLRKVGHTVISPAEGGVGKGDIDESTYKLLIRRGLSQLLECEAIALLSGWESSQGASFERDVAESVGMFIGTVDQVETMGLKPLWWKNDENPGGETDLSPRRQYEGDAGFDLICSEDRHIGYRQFVDVPCGIRVALPVGVWALIIGRSSTLRQRELMVAPGVIDNGWRGPLFAGVWNLGDQAAEVQEGDRIAQLIPFPLTSAELQLRRTGGELPESDRGERGFGSTGP